MSKTCSGTTHSDAQIKLAQLQVERIKDEDEQWISGEELYTEGSSDDDDAALRAKRKYDERYGRTARRNPKTSSAKDKSNLQEHKSSITGQCLCVSPSESVQRETGTVNAAGATAASQDLCDIHHPLQSENDGCDLLVEIDDSEISWRPKRGSIKLPNVAAEGRLVELLTNSEM